MTPQLKNEEDLSREVGFPSDRTLGSTASDNRLLRSVKAWMQARAERFAEKHQMETFACEFKERADWEGGNPGVSVCYRAAAPISEWCAACQARDPHFHRMVQLRHIEKIYWRGLCSLVDRREKARAAGAVDPHGGITTD